MANKLPTKLQEKLEELLGTKNVYYQPPESVKMNYPAIRYTKSEIDSRFANNTRYSSFTAYDVTVIDRKPDNEVIQKILNLPYSSFDRHYVSDNLNHDVIILYF